MCDVTKEGIQMIARSKEIHEYKVDTDRLTRLIHQNIALDERKAVYIRPRVCRQASSWDNCKWCPCQEAKVLPWRHPLKHLPRLNNICQPYGVLYLFLSLLVLSYLISELSEDSVYSLVPIY